MAGKGKAAPKKGSKGKGGKVKPGSIAGGFIRTGHGAGAGQPRVEVPPPDEIAKPDERTVSLVESVPPERDRSGRFVKGNRVSSKPRLRANRQGSIDTSDPAFRPFKRRAKEYSAARRAELLKTFGYVSVGVAAMVESAAAALSVCRFLEAMAQATLSPELFKRSADLGALARQHELASFELCAREAVRHAEILTLTSRPTVNIHCYGNAHDPDDDADDPHDAISIAPDAEARRLSPAELGDLAADRERVIYHPYPEKPPV